MRVVLVSALLSLVGLAFAQSAVPTCVTCPATDDAGFAVGPSDQTNAPAGTVFCSYPATPGEDQLDFYCTTTGVLVTDNDAGFCPAQAPNTCARQRRSPVHELAAVPQPVQRIRSTLKARRKLEIAGRMY
ncbi:hypothetical protein RQP46_008731 [Phenoliferia psychrophenolica]